MTLQQLWRIHVITKRNPCNNLNKIQQHYGVTEWQDKAMIRLGSGNQLKHKHRKASLSDQNTATDSVSGGRLLVILQCRRPIWAVERRKKVCFFVFFQFSQRLYYPISNTIELLSSRNSFLWPPYCRQLWEVSTGLTYLLWLNIYIYICKYFRLLDQIVDNP